MRRYFIFFISILLIASALGGLYFLIVPLKKPTSEAIKAIPIDAAVVVKANSFGRLKEQLHRVNPFWNGMKGFQWIAKTDELFSFFDSLKNHSQIFSQLIIDNSIYISAHPVGNGDGSLIFLANVPERLKTSDVKTLISDIFSKDYTQSIKDYSDADIYTFSRKSRPNETVISIALHKGVVLVSSSRLMIESAIGQMESQVSLLDDASFVNVLRTAGTKVVANVFINHQKLPMLFLNSIHTGQRKGFRNLSRIGTWSELDLTIRNDSFYLNGFGQVSDTLNTFFRVFEKQKPVSVKVPAVLPAQTAALIHYGISDLNTYLTSYQKYLEGFGLIHAYKHSIDKESRQLGTNLVELYKSIFDSELSLAFIPFDGLSYHNCWFVATRVKSQSFARQELINAISSFARKNNQNLSSFERDFVVDREKSVRIYRFPLTGFHRALFGNVFSESNEQYFTFIDTYVVFGNSVEALSRLILANIHNKHLAGDESFKAFSEGLSLESNFTAYINPGKAEMLYGKMLETNTASRLLARIEVAQTIQGIGIQLTSGKGMIFNNVFARYSPYLDQTPKTVWETKLDTTFSMKPQLVINHNTQNREIFVQDNKNNLYLINDVGRVLWKRPIQEPIIGEVNQVDILRNGRLQLLFNTRTFLYLVDRNGNNVEGFPVKLRSPATNPVAVFDYEGNRDYRFFVAGEDRKIYPYDRKGNLIAGWAFDRTEKAVTKVIQHFASGGRDYIVVSDENRVYILDRRGNERVKLSQFFQPAINGTIALIEGSRNKPARLATSDSQGNVRLIGLNGEVELLSLGKFSANHTFECQDVNGDGNRDFIFLEGNKLLVFDNNGRELISHKFENELNPKIIYFHFGARDRKIGVVSSDASQIFLINGNGSIYKGFPLKGITPFSIGQFANTRTTFNLIVGSSAGFVLNYAVQ